MPELKLVLLLGFGLLFQYGLCQSETQKGRDNKCGQKVDCASCIQTQGCCWCSKNEDMRCLLANYSTTCADGRECYNPTNERIMSDEVDKRLGVTEANETVQIRPQNVYLKLRVGESYSLELQYEQATGYPVDLYYLMDLSNSMKDDKDNLFRLGNELAKAMRNLTNNFKLGFGSFVDKVAMPFVSTNPSKLNEPCPDCERPYSFKNHLPLTVNTEEFSKKVNETKVSGNLDSPEGGFDALMQAMVCDKEIGWREKARHLLVFSTDASFHQAGDGKLAGIVLPNDGNCHLENGEYNKYLEYDYPSISQLNQKAQQKNMNLIFAVSKQTLLYNELQKRIKGASSGILDESSSNVISLVLRQYDKLVDSVTLDNDNNEYLSVSYFTKCLNESMPLLETKTCSGTRVNLTVNYTAVIQALKCPADPSERHQTLVIKPVSVNENLTVNIEIICDCPCEAPGDEDYIENDVNCNDSKSVCGVCMCDDTRTGTKCQCLKDEILNVVNNSACMNKNTQGQDVVCSGQGTCVCGKCECKDKEKYKGTFCECDNFTCQRWKNRLCAGNGRCECGSCICDEPYTGDDCSCNDELCVNPDTNIKCSGRGECKCGDCKCDDPMKYTGPYCNVCRTCPGELCTELSKCVECIAYNDGNCGTENCHQRVNVTLVDTLGDEDRSLGKHKCYQPDDSGCTFMFIYQESVNQPLMVHAQKSKECRTPINVLALVLGITGGTVIIGLLTLIGWKIVTDIHDRLEYTKFEKERALSTWGRAENPLYKPSTSTFNNPIFGQ